MEINIVRRDMGAERLLAEAELIFGPEAGLLSGLKLVGFSIWRHDMTLGMYITFPSRSFGTGQDRRYFDFLRSMQGVADAQRRLRDAILAAYRAAVAQMGDGSAWEWRAEFPVGGATC